jgi:hypothetical protein
MNESQITDDILDEKLYSKSNNVASQSSMQPKTLKKYSSCNQTFSKYSSIGQGGISLFRGTVALSVAMNSYLFRRTVPLLVQVQDIPRLDLHMGNYSYTALHYTKSQVSNNDPQWSTGLLHPRHVTCNNGSHWST